MKRRKDTLRAQEMPRKIQLAGIEINTALWCEARLHEELNIIWLYASDIWRDSLLCVPLTFTDPLEVKTAWERLCRSQRRTDLTDLTISAPFNAMLRVEVLMAAQEVDKEQFI